MKSGRQKNTNPRITNFIAPYSKKSGGAKTNNLSNQKNQCLNPDKKVPYKVDPMYGSRNRSNSPGGGKPGGGPDQNGPDINRKIKLEKSDPIVDADVWDSIQRGSSRREKKRKKLKSLINPKFTFDEFINSGHKNIIVEVDSQVEEILRRKHIRINDEQTLTHLHHLKDLNVPVPKDFNMSKYRKLDRQAKIEYGKNKLPIETRIMFQNKLGEAVSGKVKAYRGFTGIRKKPTPIIVKALKGGYKLISLIGDDGTHLTSYVLSKERYEILVKDNFWLLKRQNI